jgi:hypothetical protein
MVMGMAEHVMEPTTGSKQFVSVVVIISALAVVVILLYSIFDPHWKWWPAKRCARHWTELGYWFKSIGKPATYKSLMHIIESRHEDNESPPIRIGKEWNAVSSSQIRLLAEQVGVRVRGDCDWRPHLIRIDPLCRSSPKHSEMIYSQIFCAGRRRDMQR